MEYQTNGLNHLSKQFHDFQVKMGFTDSNITQRLMLSASELFEAFDAFRNDKRIDINSDVDLIDGRTIAEDLFRLIGNNDLDNFKRIFESSVKDTFEDELADSIIRILAMCGENYIDIGTHVQLKMKFNELRGFKYGGKKF